MRNKKLVFLATFIVLILGLIYFFSYDTNEGKTYPDKVTLCIQFTQSYLKTIPKVEPEFNDEKWQMAVDIETEINDLCQLELNREAIKNYTPTALEKYKNY